MGPPARRVHPHVRGEESGEEIRQLSEQGPPPRAWGRDRRHQGALRGHRSTPTCVGKRRGQRQHADPALVHPHVRGEEHAPLLRMIHAGGPPPRAWGRDELAIRRLPQLGSTPTCVGKSRRSSRSPPAMPVHPHVRGEECPLAPVPQTALGPPPRAWGRVHLGYEDWSGAGSTPTCVGKRARRRPDRRAGAVHPHVRGEESVELLIEAKAAGPPPRAWGRVTRHRSARR